MTSTPVQRLTCKLPLEYTANNSLTSNKCQHAVRLSAVTQEARRSWPLIAAIDSPGRWAPRTQGEPGTGPKFPKGHICCTQTNIRWPHRNEEISSPSDEGLIPARHETCLKATNPSPPLRVFQSKAQTRAFYNKISRVYDLLSDRSEAPMRKAGLELLKARAGESVLEIGFGTGHTLAALARAVGPKGKVFGLDLSDTMLKLAQEHLVTAGLVERTRLRRGDAVQLPYADGIMDGVFMSFTLELFDTPEIPKVLRECKRVLRPRGRIVVVGMSKAAKHDPLIGVFEWTHKHFPNFLDCRPIYVREAIERAGFEVKRALKKHMWIPVEIVLGSK